MKVLIKSTWMMVDGKKYPQGTHEVTDKETIEYFKRSQARYNDCVVGQKEVKPEVKKEAKKAEKKDNADKRTKLIFKLEKAGFEVGTDFQPDASEEELKKLLSDSKK